MKTLLLFLSFFTVSLSYSQDWVLMFEVEGETYYHRPHTDETAWIKVVSEKTEYYPNRTLENVKMVDGYRLVLFKFDCRLKKMGMIQSTVYSKEGKVLDTIKEKEYLVEMDYPNPDSIGESMLEVFCAE